MRRYYLTTITGKGTRSDPFRPKVADYAGGFEWGMLDLREDCTGVSGLAVAYADTLFPIEASGVSLLGSDLKANLAAASKQAFVSALGVDLGDSSLPGMLAELLSMKRPGLCPAIRKMSDNKTRIFLGGLIYGDPLPEYGKGTFIESFNKADSTTLGPDLAWEKWGDTGWQVKSNQGYRADIGDEIASPTNTNSSDDFYTQIKINSWTSRPELANGVVTRANNSPRYWYGAFAQIADNNHTFEKVVNGSWTLLASIATAVSAGEILYLSSDGSSHIVKKNGSQIWSGSDSSIVNYYRAGMGYYAGSSGSDAQVYVDDFESADLLAITPKTSADTGAGADVKDTGQPLAQSLLSETGAGAESTFSRAMVFLESGNGLDAGVDYPAAALTGAEAGAGAESLMTRILAVLESGTGLDAGVDYPAAALAGAEAGAGEEFLPSRILAAFESGLGLDGKEGGNPLADLLAFDAGVGLDAVIALVQSVARISGDSGLGADTLTAFLALATDSDTGSGVDTLIARWLSTMETGSGFDLASLLASVIGTGETGSATEEPLFLPAIVSGDAGLGSELVFLLKAIIGNDGGRAVDMLKYMIETAGSSTDMRLHLRSGQAGRAGEGRQAHRRQGQVGLPSKEVGL